MTRTLKIFSLLAVFALAISCSKPEPDYSAWYETDEDDTPAPVPGDGAEAEFELSVMSFNVRYPASSDTGDKAWKNRRSGVYAMLKEKKPMLVGLQECYISQRSDIMNNVEGYECYGVGRTDGKSSGETTSILYDKSLFSLVENGTFWLTEKDINEPNTGWDASINRTATWAKFEMKSDGQQFYYVNTHLDHQGATAKSEGLKLIQWKINELNPGGLPVVLTGDFNEEQTSAIFNSLSLKNARKEAPLTDNFLTSNGWGSKNQQIDHIFFGSLEVLSFETIRDRWEGYTYISDHYPVMATFNFIKK